MLYLNLHRINLILHHLNLSLLVIYQLLSPWSGINMINVISLWRGFLLSSLLFLQLFQIIFIERKKLIIFVLIFILISCSIVRLIIMLFSIVTHAVPRSIHSGIMRRTWDIMFSYLLFSIYIGVWYVDPLLLNWFHIKRNRFWLLNRISRVSWNIVSELLKVRIFMFLVVILQLDFLLSISTHCLGSLLLVNL